MCVRACVRARARASVRSCVRVYLCACVRVCFVVILFFNLALSVFSPPLTLTRLPPDVLHTIAAPLGPCMLARVGKLKTHSSFLTFAPIISGIRIDSGQTLGTNSEWLRARIAVCETLVAEISRIKGQASWLVYYLIREIKTWLWTLTTSQYTMTHILYFKSQRTVIENTKVM